MKKFFKLVLKFFKSLLSTLINIIIICAILLCAETTLFVDTTNILKLEQIDIQSEKINNSIKIVQISDLHDAEFGENNVELIDMIVQQEPDIIVATGDMFDASRIDLNKTYNVFKQLCDNTTSTIVYIPGNHELGRLEFYEALKDKLKQTRTIVLNNEIKAVHIKNEEINIVSFDTSLKYNVDKLNEFIDASDTDFNNFNLVLSHQPENFNSIIDLGVNFNMDLILSGHAHGGQLRLGSKAAYAPNQGFFPQYTNGLYTLHDDVKLIVNRGLGNSQFPIRINNYPEVLVININ